MKSTIPAFFAGACAVVLFGAMSPDPIAPAAFQQDQLAKAMQDKAALLKPGKHHKELERFVGSWSTEMRLFMGGKPMVMPNGKAVPASVGSATFRWLMKGRWLQQEAQSPMFGQHVKSFSIFGYDNFKKSFVTTSVSSMDTAMNRSEGDMDPGGKMLLSYGTIDEYLTGEHDKMVKTVWRFLSKDKMAMEIHDLPIGDKHTKVLEVVYTREK